MNEDLEKRFAGVAEALGYTTFHIKNQRRKIRTTSIDLREYYAKHGNFDNLPIEQMHGFTKGVLEFLIDKDVDFRSLSTSELFEEVNARKARYIKYAR